MTQQQQQQQQQLQKESFTVQCTDGVTLHGVLLIPQQPKAVVQFNNGTATKKEFYLSFLEYVAEHGFICCLWDYRGSGASAAVDMRNCDYTFSDYGLKDMPAMKQYLNHRFPELPFLLLGHSAGGQQVGFMHNLEGVKGMVCFAVSTGYAPHMPLGYRLKSHYFFYIFTPLSILLTGYISAKRFKIMEDLPKNVVLEWRNWCAHQDYFFHSKFAGNTLPVGSFKNYDFPIHLFWAVDDTISNEKNTHNYWKHIKSSRPVEMTRYTPQELGIKNLGHFGFFKKSRKNDIWAAAVGKLEAFLSDATN
jgi:predicted alpha/beta hydrolase